MIEAEHSCMTMRGVKKHGASTVDDAVHWRVYGSADERKRFLALLSRGAQMSAHVQSELEEGPDIRAQVSRRRAATCVTVDAEEGDVLMVAHMNAEALERTLASGHRALLVALAAEPLAQGRHLGADAEASSNCASIATRTRCWRGCTVGGDGGACHTGRRSCFYRRVEHDDADGARLTEIAPQ